jgi:hypothetical protein
MFHWLREVLQVLYDILHTLRDILRELKQRPTSVKIKYVPRKENPLMPLPLKVGESRTAIAVVLNQKGQPMEFDFSANPPQWAVDQPAVEITPGPSPESEGILGVSPTTTPAILSVIVPGVASPTAQDEITVTAEPDVATSVVIQFQ